MYVASVLAIVASTALTVGLYFMKREAERLPARQLEEARSR